MLSCLIILTFPSRKVLHF